jgi:hypothetical protein
MVVEKSVIEPLNSSPGGLGEGRLSTAFSVAWRRLVPAPLAPSL